MKEALQQLEAEQVAPKKTIKNHQICQLHFEYIRNGQHYAVKRGHQWLSGCVSGCIQSIKENHREQTDRCATEVSGFIKSIRLTMLMNNISNLLNIIKFFIMIYNNIYNGSRSWHHCDTEGESQCRN